MDFKALKTNPLLKKRYKADRRFWALSLGATAIAFIFIILLISGIFIKGYDALWRTEVKLELSKTIQENALKRWDYQSTVLSMVKKTLPTLHIETEDEFLRQVFDASNRKILYQSIVLNSQEQAYVWLPLSESFESLLWLPHHELTSGMSIFEQLKTQLMDQNRIRKTFNKGFFLNTDSRNPKTAGIKGAVVGSLYLTLIILVFAFPIGVGAAIYLEEFASRSRLTSFLEVNISNLAAIPSIVFGLLGLAFFLNTLNMPRSSSLVGGLTLALMTFPTIITTSRIALRSIPKTLRDAAYGLGASKIEVIWHHVLPLAFPGVVTGTLIGLVRALGETAPLLMIGMMAFIVECPTSILDPSSALPIQIFTWAKNPEPAFLVNAAAGISILMIFLIVLNLIAIFLRHKFEYRYQ